MYQVNCVLIVNKYYLILQTCYFDYQRPTIGHVSPFLIAPPSVVQVHESGNRKEKQIRPNIDHSKLSPLEGNVNVVFIFNAIHRINYNPMIGVGKTGLPLGSDLFI